jgi:hypothetical protein
MQLTKHKGKIFFPSAQNSNGLNKLLAPRKPRCIHPGYRHSKFPRSAVQIRIKSRPSKSANAGKEGKNQQSYCKSVSISFPKLMFMAES